VLATTARSFPTDLAMASCVMPNSAARR